MCFKYGWTKVSFQRLAHSFIYCSLPVNQALMNHAALLSPLCLLETWSGRCSNMGRGSLCSPDCLNISNRDKLFEQITQVRRNKSLKGVFLPNLGSGILNNLCQSSIPSIHPSSLNQSQLETTGVLFMIFKIKEPAATLSFYKV